MWKCLYIAQALSEGQCGILTMIDTPILSIFCEKKSSKMWKRLYIARALSLGRCGILTMIDTLISVIFMRKKSSDFGHFYRDIT